MSRYIGISQEQSRFSNTTSSQLEDDIRRKADVLQELEAGALTLDQAMHNYNQNVDQKRAKISILQDEILAANKEQARLDGRRYCSGSLSTRNQGECCKKKGIRIGDGWDGSCLTNNSSLQNAQLTLAKNAQAEIDKLEREIDSDQKKAFAAEQKMKDVRVEITKAATDLNLALAELEQGKALNNTEALAAREKLAEANRRRETELQALQNQLAQINSDSAVKEGLIQQETQALQASADLQKGSMPMVIGFVALVVLSFVLQPMFKKA